MNIQHRPYIDDDLPALQNALATWIQEAGDLGYCHVGDIPHRIYNGMRGRLPLNEIVHIWENSHEIIGFVIAEPYHNAIDVFVSPATKGTQAEVDMLQQGYDITRRIMNDIGHADKAIMIDVHQGDEKWMQSALAVGFENHGHWMNITEQGLDDDIPEPKLPEGFTVRPATMDEYAQLAAVHNSAFSPNWTPELYRDEVMHKPGYVPGSEYVVVASDGQFAAFTKTWLDEINKVGLFEPVGTHSDFQRRGLGRAMMLHVLHVMKRCGMEKAQVGHMVDNPASAGLYNNIGFRTKYELMEYKKA